MAPTVSHASRRHCRASLSATTCCPWLSSLITYATVVRRPPPPPELPRQRAALLPEAAAGHSVTGAAALSTFQKLPGGGGGSWCSSPSATAAAPPLRQLPPSAKAQRPEGARGGTAKVMPSPASALIFPGREAAAAASPAQPHRLGSLSSGLLRARRAKQLPSRVAPSAPRRRLLSGALSPEGTPLPGDVSLLLGASVAAQLARCRVSSTRGGTALPFLGGRTSRLADLPGGAALGRRARGAERPSRRRRASGSVRARPRLLPRRAGRSGRGQEERPLGGEPGYLASTLRAGGSGTACRDRSASLLGGSSPSPVLFPPTPPASFSFRLLRPLRPRASLAAGVSARLAAARPVGHRLLAAHSSRHRESGPAPEEGAAGKPGPGLN